jgi:hypothetical protein
MFYLGSLSGWQFPDEPLSKHSAPLQEPTLESELSILGAGIVPSPLKNYDTVSPTPEEFYRGPRKISTGT